jgi:membrane protein implicated in regulation of membrane protease activity
MLTPVAHMQQPGPDTAGNSLHLPHPGSAAGGPGLYAVGGGLWLPAVLLWVSIVAIFLLSVVDAYLVKTPAETKINEYTSMK